jgi:hypothetical protein
MTRRLSDAEDPLVTPFYITGRVCGHVVVRAADLAAGNPPICCRPAARRPGARPLLLIRAFALERIDLFRSGTQLPGDPAGYLIFEMRPICGG